MILQNELHSFEPLQLKIQKILNWMILKFLMKQYKLIRIYNTKNLINQLLFEWFKILFVFFYIISKTFDAICKIKIIIKIDIAKKFIMMKLKIY